MLQSFQDLCRLPLEPPGLVPDPLFLLRELDCHGTAAFAGNLLEEFTRKMEPAKGVNPPDVPPLMARMRAIFWRHELRRAPQQQQPAGCLIAIP
jgi:hypothetical protein